MCSPNNLSVYSVESPCGCSPGVGSFLANPGLSKEQLVPSCVVVTFAMANTFIGIMVQYLRRCIVITFKMADTFMRMFSHFTIYLFVYRH